MILNELAIPKQFDILRNSKPNKKKEIQIYN